MYGQLLDLLEIPSSSESLAGVLGNIEAGISPWNAAKVDVFSICYVYPIQMLLCDSVIPQCSIQRLGPQTR